MKKIYQILFICFISITGFARVTVNQGFENSGFLSGGVTGTSTTATSGWYQYIFTVPTTFNSSINYLMFKAYSQYGDNQGMDDVSYTAYPCLNLAIGGYSVPVCSGTSLTLTDTTPGGFWSSSNTSVATTGAATGTITLSNGYEPAHGQAGQLVLHYQQANCFI